MGEESDSSSLFLYSGEFFMNLSQRLFMLLFFLIPAALLSAHPHMMLTSRCTIHTTEKGVAGITLEWEFDKFFSADVNMNFDEDKNGIFDSSETENVFQYAFSNLKKYNYFVFFRQGDRRFSPHRVEDFRVWNKNGDTMVYSFFVSTEDYPDQDISLAVYDSSFFCHVSYDKDNPVTFDSKTDSRPYRYTLKENKDYPVYYDPFAPATDLTVYTEWRPGLKTFYPTEIQIELP